MSETTQLNEISSNLLEGLRMKYRPKHIFYVARVWYESLTLSPLSHYPKPNTHTGSIEKWCVQARFCFKTSVV